MMVTLNAKLLDVASLLGMYVIDIHTVKMAVMNKIVVRSKLMKINILNKLLSSMYSIYVVMYLHMFVRPVNYVILMHLMVLTDVCYSYNIFSNVLYY